MYADDINKVVHPYWATQRVRESLHSSRNQIFNIQQFISPFANKDLETKRLIQEIEHGQVFLLDDAKGFGTSINHTSSSEGYRFRLEQIKQSGKERPQFSPMSVQTTESAPPEEEVIEEEPATERKEKVEFLCGWAECRQHHSKSEAIAALFSNKFSQDKCAMISCHNEHLGANVRQGEIIVIPTRHPKTPEEEAELNELKAEARKVSATLHSIKEEEAETIVRFFPLLDYFGTMNLYSEDMTRAGAVVGGVGAYIESIKTILEDINKLFLDEAVSAGATRYLSEAFYTSRALLFNKIDSSLHKMTFNCLGIPTYKKLKHTLGLSTKRTVHHGKDLINEKGILKGFAQRLEIISNWVKHVKKVAIVGAVLDACTSVPVIAEAFTSEHGKPLETTVREAARVAGAYLVGNIGASAGGAIATFIVGAIGGGAIALGVGVLVLGTVGAYYGAKHGANIAQALADQAIIIAKWMLVDKENGGFFDWNAEQL